MQSGLLLFLARRAALAVPLLLIIIVVTFFLVRLAPGDPAYLLAGDAPTPAFLQQVRTEYDLDKPGPQQLLIYMAKAGHGDLGTSIYYHRPVLEVILGRLPNTLLLTGAALLLASLAGIGVGVLSARYRDCVLDSVLSGVSLGGYSIPTFWLGQLLVLIFAIVLGWFPTGGMTDVRQSYTGLDHITDVLHHLILPTVTLALFELGLIARFTRTGMIEALDKDYVTVAYAKGMDDWGVIFKHALPNAMLTTITVIGLEFGVLLAGAVVTETIFGWPGMGRLFYDAIFRRDFPLLTGCFIFASAAVIVVNLLTDVLYALVDPRVYRAN